MRASPILAVLAACLLVTACSDDSARRQAATRSADEVAITYAIGGRGPAVVLIHCWGCDRGFWDETVADLEQDHRLLAIDLAGHGDSGRNRTDYTMDAFAGDVLAVMDAERIAEAVLVGHSMGGYVSMAVAARAPERVTGIVGVDILHAVDPGFPREQLDQFVQMMRDDYPGTVGHMVDSMFPEGSDPVHRQRVLDNLQAMAPEIAVSAFDNIYRMDLGAAADRYGRPLRLIMDDARPVQADQWQEHGVEVHVDLMHGVGHYPMLTAGEDFRGRLRNAVDAFAAP